MQMYELTVIYAADEAKFKSASEKVEKTIKDAQGKVVKKDDWGKRDLAYPINKNQEGTFAFYILELEEQRAQPFARLLENDDNVLRHLLVRSTKGTEGTESTKSTKGDGEKVEMVEKVVKVEKAKEKKDKKTKAKAKKTVKSKKK